MVADAARAREAVAELIDVVKVYRARSGPVKALDGVSLQVKKGELLAIVGPSGSGKSTLLHILGCLDSPTSGSVFVAGEKVAGLSRRRLAFLRSRFVGFVFQQQHLVSTLTAAENVSVPLRYQGVSRSDALRRAREWLERVGLGRRLDHYPDQLSGGEKQRAAVARALVHQPAVVLADEPTGELDSKTGAALLDLIREINQSVGQTFVLVTHDPAVAASCDRVLELVDGRFVSQP